MEPYTKEMHEQYIQEKKEREAKAEQARKDRVEKETARRAWLADGGDEKSFEAAWPKVRDEERRRRVFDADRQARSAMRNSRVSSI